MECGTLLRTFNASLPRTHNHSVATESQIVNRSPSNRPHPIPKTALGWPVWMCALLLVAAGGVVGGLVGAILAFIAAVFPLAIAGAIKQSRIHRRYTYAWYRQTFPELIDRQGKVCCHQCGQSQVRVTNLMNKTYTRAHVCGQCGETLYFSPER